MSQVGQPVSPAPAPQTPQPPQMNYNQPAQSQPAQPQLPDPDLAYTDKAEYNRQLTAYIQAMNALSLQQYSTPFVSNAADTALHLSRGGRFKEVWDKWEPEVMAELANIPRQHWNVTLLDKAAQIVRSNHIDELVQEKAQSLAAQPHSSVVGSSGEAPSTPGSDLLPLDKLFFDNDPAIARFKEAGLSAADVRQRLPAMGTTEEEYTENLKKSAIIVSGNHTQVTAGGYR